MKHEYHTPKYVMAREDINFMQLFFDNGDYLSVSGEEIVSLSLLLYDGLILSENAYCPVIQGGSMRLALREDASFCYDGHFVCREKDYRRSRAQYIRKRLLDGGLRAIRLFDENNWHFTYHCRASAKDGEDGLFVGFLPDPSAPPAESGEHTILLADVGKKRIDRITLDFENCESFSVDRAEIANMDLKLSRELCWGAGDHIRAVRSGHLRLKLRKKHSCGRQVHLLSGKEPKIGRLEKRLCGKEGFSGHDICHLYISYRYAGFGTSFTERLYVPELCDNETLEAHGCAQEDSFEEEADCGWEHLSGYAERLGDGSILVTFGKEAKKYLAGEDGNAAPEE